MQVPWMARIIREMESSRSVYTIKINMGGRNEYDEATHTIYWDHHQATKCTPNGGTQSPAMALWHELMHARGPMLPWRYAPGGYDNVEEKRVVDGPERDAARALCECVRINHRGDPFYVSNPILH
jgi:hypothetical protein